jgi:NitT/TauT family transport system permease protein
VSTPTWTQTARRRASLVAVWCALLLAWEAGYRIIGWRSWIFPAPSHVVDAALAMLNIHSGFGEPFTANWPHAAAPPAASPASTGVLMGFLTSPLLSALAVSGVRLAIGFGVSLVVGLIAGVLLWRSKFLNALLGPLFLGLQTLPSVCWVPLAVLTLGIGERGVLSVLILGSVFSMAIALRDGLGGVPPIYRAAGTMLGASGLRLYTSVLLPACLPALAGTLRQGFSFAWRSLLGAELILMTQHRGLGFLLGAGRDFADVAQVVAMMAIMVAVGMAADRWVFAAIEKQVKLRFGLSHG